MPECLNLFWLDCEEREARLPHSTHPAFWSTGEEGVPAVWGLSSWVSASYCVRGDWATGASALIPLPATRWRPYTADPGRSLQILTRAGERRNRSGYPPIPRPVPTLLALLNQPHRG